MVASAVVIAAAVSAATSALILRLSLACRVDQLNGDAELAWEQSDSQNAIALWRQARGSAWFFLPGRRARLSLRLGKVYAGAGLRHEAALELRGAAKSEYLPDDLQAESRALLADVLESLGDRRAADKLRGKSPASGSAAASKAPGPSSRIDPPRRRAPAGSVDEARVCLSRGDTLQRDHQYDRAAAEYERGLDTPDPVLREKLLVMVALASSNAGHPDRAIRWSEELLAGGVQSAVNERAAHGLAAINYAAVGELDRAESHARERVRLAGDEPSQRCAALGILSSVLLQKGDVEAAVEAAEEADRAGIGDPHHRAAWRAMADIALQRGRFDEAARMLQTVLESKVRERRAPDARSDAADAVALARVYLTGMAFGYYPKAELARVRNLLENAMAGYAADRLGNLSCDGVRAWYLAEEGQADAAVSLVVDIERRRQAQQPENRALTIECLAVCGFVSFALRGFKQSAGYWQERLKTCNPIARPESAYWLARCLEGMNDPRAAFVYERAAATGIDTSPAAFSRRRLETLGVKTGQGMASAAASEMPPPARAPQSAQTPQSQPRQIVAPSTAPRPDLLAGHIPSPLPESANAGWS